MDLGAEHGRPLTTLLIDNYDSFTFNLVQLLAVCLGHQALCFLSGSVIGRAPTPVHGRTSRIVHAGDDLFAGVPTGLLATRYHSLIVEKLSNEFACIAECDDGLAMAAVGGHQQPRAAAGAAGGARMLDCRELEQVPDAAAAFEALFGTTDVAFWIDTLATDGSGAPRTYIGPGLGPGSEVLRHRVGDPFVNVRRPDGSSSDIETSVFDVLGQRPVGLVPTAGTQPLNLGYVGWLGYELRDLGGPGHGRRSPDDGAFFVLADRMLVIDHASSQAWVAALRNDATDTGAAMWIQTSVEALRDLCPLPIVSLPADVALPHARLRHDVPAYLALIQECQELIRAGECDELFRVLREVNLAPFAAFLRTPEVAVVGSSPERFLTVDAGALVRKPMKGRARAEQIPTRMHACAPTWRACQGPCGEPDGR